MPVPVGIGAPVPVPVGIGTPVPVPVGMTVKVVPVPVGTPVAVGNGRSVLLEKLNMSNQLKGLAETALARPRRMTAENCILMKRAGAFILFFYFRLFLD